MCSRANPEGTAPAYSLTICLIPEGREPLVTQLPHRSDGFLAASQQDTDKHLNIHVAHSLPL